VGGPGAGARRGGAGGGGRRGLLRGQFHAPRAQRGRPPIGYTTSVLAKRIIPCLDVDRGRVVKGVRFVELRDAGDPVECAAAYDDQGADELTFLDITASSDQRDTILEVVARTAARV